MPESSKDASEPSSVAWFVRGFAIAVLVGVLGLFLLYR
jgi:hypothetical protein